jgi:hypothetical protein
MPLTLPTHPLAVLPLKLWRPRWFDGVGLVVGAIVPDVAYAAHGYGVTIRSHAWHAPLWWALPVGLVGVRLIRWAAPTVAAHLPGGGPLALRDYGSLGAVRHRWWITAVSLVLGAVSHNVWDALTHPRVDGGVVLLPFLHRQVTPGVAWWELLLIVSDFVGFVVGVTLAVEIGRRRLVRSWHPEPVSLPRRCPTRFWSAFGLVVLVGLALLPLQPVTVTYLPEQAVRVMVVVGAALLAGATATRGGAEGRRGAGHMGGGDRQAG